LYDLILYVLVATINCLFVFFFFFFQAEDGIRDSSVTGVQTCALPISGSGELLCALGLLHGRDGGEIIAAQPTYEELANYARRSGAALKFVPVDEQFRHDLAAMRAAVSERTRAIYICNPNNPTGTAIGATAIRAFVESLPEHVTTIVDEAYMDFAVGTDLRSVADLIGTGRRLVV